MKHSSGPATVAQLARFDEEAGRTHIPAKLGLGRYTEVDPPDGSATSLTYVFLGLGW